MSDLIGRIAARAVGAPPLAQPRVSPAPLRTGGLEVVDEEVVAPIAASPVEPVIAPPALAGRPAEAETPPGERAVSPTPTAEAQPAAASQGPAAEERPRRERLLPALERVSADPTETKLEPPPAEPRAAATAVPLPAAAISPPAHRVAHRGATVAHGYTRPTEPPPVRVHIGRLEVRANLQEPPRPAPLPQPAEPEGLSLSDYLQGKR